MVSASGRFVIVFNGEIYNYIELRDQLHDPTLRLRGRSDTEVLLAAFERWGVAAALPRANGMFALAVWDREQRVLNLARDRFGEKPLYFARHGTSWLFASELKALRAFPGFAPEIDRDALALFLRHNCIPAPYSIFRGVRKLMPGSLLTVTADAEPRETIYWSARSTAESAQQDPFQGTEDDAREQLDVLLRRSIKMRMMADVPLGAFLSGGIDSSTVVAAMQAQSAQPVRTFTIGHSDAQYNEAEDARRVAQHLGTEHTELTVTPSEALAVIPRLPHFYDEPFSDSSQVPTFLVSQLARRSVTVALSGDGGDELFGGYNRHSWVERLWKRVGWIPRPGRRLAAGLVGSISPAAWDTMFRAAAGVLPRSSPLRIRTPGDKLHKLAGVLPAQSSRAMYELLTSHWQRPDAVVLGATEPPTLLTAPGADPKLATLGEQMMLLDTVTYLPDDILTKVDRASMAVSLEARVPMLDPDVFAFAWRIPLAMKLRGGQGKWLLREVLHRYVPHALVDRPKFGFGVPLADWLRGPLRSWAEALLSPERLRREGFFEGHEIEAKWREHLSGRGAWQYHLWDVLMFQSWLEATRSLTASSAPGSAAGAGARTSN